MKKKVLFAGLIVVLILFLVKGIRIQSVDEYYMTHMEDIGPDSETVTLSINCSTVREAQNWRKLSRQLQDEKYVPKDGWILPETTFVLRKGDTVYDVLNRACRYKGIQMEHQGADANVYGTIFIRGINHLYDRACGELSGWMYKVNGEFPGKGCGAYKLENGDVIEWVYTCDLGKDVGDDYMTKKKQGIEETESDTDKEDVP